MVFLKLYIIYCINTVKYKNYKNTKEGKAVCVFSSEVFSNTIDHVLLIKVCLHFNAMPSSRDILMVMKKYD